MRYVFVVWTMLLCLLWSGSVSYSLPSSVDLRFLLPPVGDQGAQESSVGWAIGYYAMGFYEKKVYGWDTSSPERQFSPAFIYNQLSGGVMDRGGRVEDALRLVRQQGCAVMSVMPYREDNCLTLPSPGQYLDAMLHRVDEYVLIFPRGVAHPLDDEVLSAIKGVLANGDVVIAEIPVFNSFRYPSPSSWRYKDGKPYLYDPTGGGSIAYQVVCIVGYKDDVVDGIGGFLIRNSWGEGWATGGDTYISYDFFKDYALEAWWIKSFSNHNIEDYISFKVDCVHRKDISVWFGNELGWEEQVYGWIGVDDERDNVEMSFDVTNALAQFPSVSRWYLRVSKTGDERDATVEYFSLHTSTDRVDSDDTPVTVSNGAEKRVYVDLALNWDVYVESSQYEGTAPLHVELSVRGNYDKNAVREYMWDFENDGVIDATTEVPSVAWRYQSAGTYYPSAVLVLSLGDNRKALCKSSIIVKAGGNGGTDDRPGKPSIVYPRSKSAVTWDSKVSSSPFSSSCGATHRSSHWVLSGDGVKVFDGLTHRKDLLVSLPLALMGIEPMHTYTVKVAYSDNKGNWSKWSDGVSFSVSGFDDFNDNGVPDRCEYDGYSDLNRNGIDDRNEGYRVLALDSCRTIFKSGMGNIEAIYPINILGVNAFVVTVSGLVEGKAAIECRFEDGRDAEVLNPLSDEDSHKLSSKRVFLVVEDGSSYDLDGLRNGRVIMCVEPLGDVLPQFSGGGGCSMSESSVDVGIPAILIIFPLFYAVKKYISKLRGKEE